MSSLPSSSASFTSAARDRFARANVDDIAEREAAAIERMADMLGQRRPHSRVQIERWRAMEAVDRGLPKPPKIFYCRAAAIEAFRKISLGIKPRRAVNFVTRADKARSFRRRLDRLVLLDALRKMPASAAPIPMAEAVKLSGFSGRTLSKAVQRGELHPVCRIGPNRSPMINPPDLIPVVARMLAPRGRHHQHRIAS